MYDSEIYQTRQIFKELFENINSGVVIYETIDNGKNFIIKEMNKAGLAICEVSIEDVIEKNLLEVFPGVDEFGFIDSLRRVWKTGKSERSSTALTQDDRMYGWTEMYIFKLPSEKLVAIFESQTKLIEVEQNFKKKVEFEKTISSISARFVNPDNIDEAINSSLKDIGILSQASRSYLFRFNNDNKTMTNTHEWCNEGVESQKNQIQNIPMDVFPWSINKLKKGEVLNIKKVEDLPPEASAEKEEFLRENIKSLIFLPYKRGEKIAGFIGFDNVRAPEKWSEDNINLLKISSNIIGNGLRRKETELKLEELNKKLRETIKKRTKELEESEEKFRLLTDQSLIGVVILQDNETVYANQKFADMVQYPHEEIMNWTLEDQMKIVHPDDREGVKNQAIKKQKGDTDVKNRYFFRFYKKKGELLWVDCFAKTIIYEGRLADFVTFVDVTEHKKMEEALQKSESEKSIILESISEHIVFQTPENTILWVNKAAADSVNSSPEELIGKKCYQIWNTLDEPCDGCPIVKAIGTNQPEVNEMNTPDGRFWIVSGYPVRDKDNNIIALVEVTREITKEKIAEKNLIESEERYRKSYYQANLYRDIFAHDINNLLQNITSSAELSSLYLNNPEKFHILKELYEIINEQVYRGKKLINNVIKIAKIDKSEIRLEIIEANRLLRNAIEFLHNSFQHRNINIQLNTPPNNLYIMANNLLLDVFENILINAVRYNDKSNIEIIIDIGKEEREDKNFIKMEFKDNGIGISDYRKTTIFERGSRKRYKSKGMGLGLSLVKKILDTYKGDIWVEDRVNGDPKQGSNFVVLIPSNH